MLVGVKPHLLRTCNCSQRGIYVKSAPYLRMMACRQRGSQGTPEGYRYIDAERSATWITLKLRSGIPPPGSPGRTDGGLNPSKFESFRIHVGAVVEEQLTNMPSVLSCRPV